MDRQNLNPDPIAIRLTQEIHEEHKPLATILFGSRARGDHDEERSDIDVMLFVDLLPTQASQEEAERKAREQTTEHHRREVQLVWMTPEEIQEDEPYLNSICSDTSPARPSGPISTGIGRRPSTTPSPERRS